MEFCGSPCRACASLRGAALKIAGERGLEAVTVAAISDRAEVLVPFTVRHLGDDPVAILVAAYRESMTALQDRFARTLAFGASWEDGLERAVHELLATLAADPARARFLFAEVLGGPAALLVERDALRERSVRLLVARHRRFGGDPELSEDLCERVESVTADAIARACLRRRNASLPALAPEILDAGALVLV